MKKYMLFLAMVLLGITSATATTVGYTVLNGEDLINTRYRFAQPIVFVERGVEFLIFPDGSFDFNTEVLNAQPHNDHYYHRRHRRGMNRTHGAPGIVHNPRKRGVLVQHDWQGRIRRIGNVFVNYDRQGRIKRVGSVYMKYRRGLLQQVGGLRILYNRYDEIVGTRGVVNFNNPTCGLWDNEGFTLGPAHNDHYNDWETNWDNNDDFYYYRKNGTVKRQKKIRP